MDRSRPRLRLLRLPRKSARKDSIMNKSNTRLQRCETQLQDFLAETLRGISIDTLSVVKTPGKWSAHENLAHLARYHQVFLQRIDLMLAEQAPVFPRYRAEEDPDWASWAGLPTQQVLVR